MSNRSSLCSLKIKRGTEGLLAPFLHTIFTLDEGKYATVHTTGASL